jgi:hypothetical protein
MAPVVNENLCGHSVVAIVDEGNMKHACSRYILLMLFTGTVCAEDNDQQLAKKLANPIADMISVPLQNNYDCCSGPGDASRYTLNVQPVIPFALNTDWNLIVRTVVPMVYQQPPAEGFSSRFGLSDSEQSFFFSPSQSTDGITWGIGPVFLLPTATNAELGSEKWGAGPTGVLLKQSGGWTLGGLANHVWSYAGHTKRERVSQTYIQPFISYTFPDTVSLMLSTETTWDWAHNEWTVPINAGISRVFRLGKQPVSLGIMGRYYADKPESGPEWGGRLVVTFLFPE